MPTFTAKSVILDIADNYGGDYIGLRSVDFWYNGSKIPMPIENFTAYVTSYLSSAYQPYQAFNTDLSKIGSWYNTSWLDGILTNQRLIIVFDSSQTFDEIRINNLHSYGTHTDYGAKNVVIYASTDVITDTTYNASIPNSKEIFNGAFYEHVYDDVEDEQILTLTEPGVTYSVTYDDNGSDSGTVPIDTTSYEEGDTVTVLGNTGGLTKLGYTFDGWNTAADGSGISYVGGDTFLMGTEDVTLYAEWLAAVFVNSVSHVQLANTALQLGRAGSGRVTHTYDIKSATWVSYRQKIGKIPALFLHNNGVFHALLNVDIFMSGTKGTSIQATLAGTPNINELTGVDWELATSSGWAVYNISDIIATKTKTTNRIVVQIRSSKLEAVRKVSNVELPGQSKGSSRPGALLTPGGWDVIPGDTFHTPTITGVARHVQVSLSPDNSRTWVYG